MGRDDIFMHSIGASVALAVALILAMPTVITAQQSDDVFKNIEPGPDGEWRGVPDDFPVTRWPEDSPIRPITYAEWKARQPAPEPFQATTLAVRAADKRGAEPGLFGVIVNTYLQPSIQSSLDIYMADLSADGYEVELIAASGGTPEQFRAFLLDKHLEGMIGAVLIGDFPVPWYEITCWGDYEDFPCDLYYMDLDGLWTDGDSDGIFDGHSGMVDPDFWIGRLTPHMTGVGNDPVNLLRNYFQKNHRYRTGGMPLANRGLMYVDDDWHSSAQSWANAMSSVYDDTSIFSDPYATTSYDYEARLPQNFEMIQVCVHSDYHRHYFMIPDGDGGLTHVGEIISIDPKAAFYNLFACSNSRYVEWDYMGGWYIFCQSFGLASVGSTKTGSMLNFGAFYGPFGSGKTIGEAFADWFSVMVWDGNEAEDICWFYGMTLCGDPTLRPGVSSAPLCIANYFDDGSGGDGDGVPEQGEMPKLIVAMENFGGAPALGVTLFLAVNDSRITINQGTSVLGDILPGQVVTNAGNPFEIAIPADYVPRIDTFFVDVVWNGGDCSNTLTLRVALGGYGILLVDDDPYNSYETRYTEYLDNALIPHLIWSASDSIPDATSLAEFEVVVWSTGAFRADLLHAGELAAMAGYLDGGGNLFLSGQGIAPELSTSDPDFLHDYLHSEYITGGYIPVAIDDPSGEIFKYGDTVAIADCPVSCGYTDRIAPVGGGIQELFYATTTDAAAVSYAGTYKTVFTPFGLEWLKKGHYRWYDRDSVFADILHFFAFSLPSRAYPVVSNTVVTPGDPTHMLEHTPEIHWTFTDPDELPQEMFHIQVSNDNLWNEVEMWDHGPVAGTDSVLTYAGAPLADGVEYFFRVRGHNGTFWSNWDVYSVRMNSIPVPMHLTPCDMVCIQDTLPELAFINFPDGEGDEVFYTFELYADEALTSLVGEAHDIPAGSDSLVSWPVPAPLTFGEDYYWRARGRDHLETGLWSETAAFVIENPVLCGDANGDTNLNVSDAVFIIEYIFKGGPAPEPECAADVDKSGSISVADAVYLINYIFKGGPAPREDCCQ